MSNVKKGQVTQFSNTLTSFKKLTEIERFWKKIVKKKPMKNASFEFLRFFEDLQKLGTRKGLKNVVKVKKIF